LPVSFESSSHSWNLMPSRARKRWRVRAWGKRLRAWGRVRVRVRALACARDRAFMCVRARVCARACLWADGLVGVCVRVCVCASPRV
jgi:hypothetical protein